jgi:hypothetical protein
MPPSRALIEGRYARMDLTHLENKPESGAACIGRPGEAQHCAAMPVSRGSANAMLFPSASFTITPITASEVTDLVAGDGVSYQQRYPRPKWNRCGRA